MSTQNIDKLTEILNEIRHIRSILPNLMRKLAYATDSSDSTALFVDVANDIFAWKQESNSLQSKYTELLHIIDPQAAAQLNTQKLEPTTNMHPQTDTGEVDLT